MTWTGISAREKKFRGFISGSLGFPRVNSARHRKSPPTRRRFPPAGARFLIIRAYRVVNLDQMSRSGDRQIQRETSGSKSRSAMRTIRSRLASRSSRPCLNVRVSGTVGSRRFTGNGPIRSTCLGGKPLRLLRNFTARVVSRAVAFDRSPGPAGSEDVDGWHAVWKSDVFARGTGRRNGGGVSVCRRWDRGSHDSELGKLPRKLAEISAFRPQGFDCGRGAGAKGSRLHFGVGWR